MCFGKSKVLNTIEHKVVYLVYFRKNYTSIAHTAIERNFFG